MRAKVAFKKEKPLLCLVYTVQSEHLWLFFTFDTYISSRTRKAAGMLKKVGELTPNCGT